MKRHETTLRRSPIPPCLRPRNRREQTAAATGDFRESALAAAVGPRRCDLLSKLVAWLLGCLGGSLGWGESWESDPFEERQTAVEEQLRTVLAIVVDQWVAEEMGRSRVEEVLRLGTCSGG